MRAAFADARVRRDERGNAEVRLRPRDLPVDVAMAVVIEQGGAEQPVGTILRRRGDRTRWAAVSSTRPPQFAGKVNVHLRPDQSAADAAKDLGTYWGEPIVIRDVVVDAPYAPPFDADQSHRPAVERALAGTAIARAARAAGSA